MIDVRPAKEYAGLRRYLRALPERRAIVAYCRGPYCVMALDAVDVLRAQGFRAHRLELGVAEWRAAGGWGQVGATPGSPP